MCEVAPMLVIHLCLLTNGIWLSLEPIRSFSLLVVLLLVIHALLSLSFKAPI
jgi:hypothetical protein